MHPSRAGLVAFSDAETGSASYRRIASHVSKCQRCSTELRRIRSDKDRLRGGHGGSESEALQSGLAGLLTSMAAWREGRSEELASEVKSRLRAHLEVYLGSPAVSLVERPGMRAEELLARTAEILEALLGPAAAEALRDDVLSGLPRARAAAGIDR